MRFFTIIMILAGCSWTFAMDIGVIWGSPNIQPTQSSIDFELYSFTELDYYSQRFGDNNFRSSDSLCSTSQACASAAFNHINYSQIWFPRLGSYSKSFWKSSLGFGMVHDHIARFFQNEIFHPLVDLPPIPRNETSSDYYLWAEIGWIKKHELNPKIEWLYSYYLTFSSFYTHAYSQIHLQSKKLLSWKYFTFDFFVQIQAGFMDGNRNNFLQKPSFMGSFQSYYASISPALRVELNQVFPKALSLIMGATSYSGILHNQYQSPEPILFQFMRLQYGSWYFQTSNDSPNHTDYGPSYTLQIGKEW